MAHKRIFASRLARRRRAQLILPDPPHSNIHLYISSYSRNRFSCIRVSSPNTFASPSSDMSAANTATRSALDSPDFSQTLSTNGHNFRLLPATMQDAPEFVNLFFSIFKNELVFRAMYGTANWDLVIARTIKQWREELEVEPTEARLRWYKVVNEDG